MFNKTNLVLAASALVLAACGGGGGGGGNNAGLPSPSLIGEETYAAVYDAATIIAGADLFERFEDGTSTTNQFGGRPTGDSSVAEGTSSISCGVYAISGSDARIGSTLATAPAVSGHAAYCSVVYAQRSGVLYRHYFKITKAGSWTTGNPAYDVTAYADTYNPTLGAHQFLPNVAHASTVTFSYTGASITGYVLNGALPATFKDNGDFLNQAGRSVVAVNGTRWAAGVTGTRTLGLNGTVSLRSNTDAQLSLRTFGSGSKADVVIGTGGALGSITLSLQ